MRGDADRLEWVEVHQPHFDVLDTALAQRVERALSRKNYTLGPNRAVKLVFYLQQSCSQLVVVATRIAHADRFIGRVGFGQGFLQRCGIPFQTVVANRQRSLGIALVAEPPHAQRGSVRHVQRLVAQLLKPVLTPGNKTRTHRR